eukprot:2189241-Prymnesium_polylepis.1
MGRGPHMQAACWHCCRGPAPTGTCRHRRSRGCTTCHLRLWGAAAAVEPRSLGRPPSPPAGP